MKTYMILSTVSTVTGDRIKCLPLHEQLDFTKCFFEA